ncbi:MAG: glycosyltransferase [Chitinophagales bacterium]
MTGSYVFFFLLYLFGWLTSSPYKPSQSSSQTNVSIIIPARNEAPNISLLLNDLLKQSYPDSLYEIIVVDDFSEDNTCQIVRAVDNPKIRLLQLKDFVTKEERIVSYKKKAIEIAIANSSGELIVTTDADCSINENWLRTIVGFYEEKKCRMIVAPVLIKEEKNFFSKFQSLDLLGLLGITGATLRLNFPTMCNGANLAFEKKIFYEVNGYGGISENSSGDDMLLMHKIAERWSGGVKFLKNKEAIVFTSAQKTFSTFLMQRMRWTSKSKSYSGWKIKLNLLLIYLFNFSVLVSLFMAIINTGLWPVLLFQIATKFILDFIFLSEVTNFFDSRRLLWLFLPIEAMHVIYIVIVGFAGNFFRTIWKGRRVT